MIILRDQRQKVLTDILQLWNPVSAGTWSVRTTDKPRVVGRSHQRIDRTAAYRHVPPPA